MKDFIKDDINCALAWNLNLPRRSTNVVIEEVSQFLLMLGEGTLVEDEDWVVWEDGGDAFTVNV